MLANPGFRLPAILQNRSPAISSFVVHFPPHLFTYSGGSNPYRRPDTLFPKVPVNRLWRCGNDELRGKPRSEDRFHNFFSGSEVNRGKPEASADRKARCLPVWTPAFPINSRAAKVQNPRFYEFFRLLSQKSLDNPRKDPYTH
jgi:hypothetical protein